MQRLKAIGADIADIAEKNRQNTTQERMTKGRVIYSMRYDEEEDRVLIYTHNEEGEESDKDKPIGTGVFLSVPLRRL